MNRTFRKAILPRGASDKLVGVLTVVGSLCSIAALALALQLRPSSLLLVWSVLVLAIAASLWIAYRMYRSWREEERRATIAESLIKTPEQEHWDEARRQGAVDLVGRYNKFLLSEDKADALYSLFLLAKLLWDAWLTPQEKEEGSRIYDAWRFIAGAHLNKDYAASEGLERAVEHMAFIWQPAAQVMLPRSLPVEIPTPPADPPLTNSGS